MPRRDFLRIAGLTVGGLMFSRFDAIAGPFSTEDFSFSLIPADKKLSKEWLASLVARGKPKVYSGSAMEFIGMPVGGFCTGQLYLGGDGRLWLWDVFNAPPPSQICAANYSTPLRQSFPVDQGFAIRVNGQTRALDRNGFPGVTFLGEYPIGTVTYRDEKFPAEVVLDAYSPFIPLNAEDSGLPATVMEFTIKNRSDSKAEVEIGGWLENAVGRFTRGAFGIRKNAISQRGDLLALESSAKNAAPTSGAAMRPDILFADFEGDDYEGWTATGEAFGTGPATLTTVPDYQGPGQMGIHGQGVVNSHATAPGGDPTLKDAATGKLASKPFRIERRYIKFLISGGGFPDKLALRLLVDGRPVRLATGHNSNALREDLFDVQEFEGRDGILEILDEHTGSWGNIGVDRIVFTDEPGVQVPVEDAPDFGTMALGLLGPAGDDLAAAEIPDAGTPEALFRALGPAKSDVGVDRPLSHRLTGGLGRKFTLAPGAEKKVVFVIAWHFPKVNYTLEMTAGWSVIQDLKNLRRYYAKRFADAAAVVGFVAENFPRLSGDTKLWRSTWYDSTLPFWLLDRTLLNISTLATATCHRFDNGRYWFWEGIYCCHGTCTHVWHYAQAIGRLFPEIERDIRERVDYGIGFQQDSGMITMRAETAGPAAATDGHAGTILRTLREHQMSPDNTFLERNWPNVKKAVEWLVNQDENGDGIITRAQPNTLDAEWFGKIPWISSLYVAALRAGEKMANEMGDTESAERWAAIAAKGSQTIGDELFHKGQYFIQRVEPQDADKLGSGYGCLIDQVFGQSWAFQVGLPRVLPEDKTRKALESLWLYNFTPDVTVFREKSPIPGGRWFAMPGEGGMVMCTFPDPEHPQPVGDGFHAFYFNECMSGFEYQVASHMIWEGGDLVEKGLAVARMIDDRYDGSRRNPWNEVECGDHYGRAMASYGVFTAVCGFEYDGPDQHIGFAPRLTPEDFRAPFTAAEGWGTFRQKTSGGKLDASLDVKWGKVPLKTFSLQLPDAKPRTVLATLAGAAVRAKLSTEGTRATISLEGGVTVGAGQSLNLQLS
jgi:non-lysosomal glucosylceramidase